MQDLASRGFIVAGIGYDDPACAGVDRSVGSTAATDMDFSSQTAFERTLGVAHQKIERVAKGASHIIDALEVLNRVDPNWPIRWPARPGSYRRRGILPRRRDRDAVMLAG